MNFGSFGGHAASTGGVPNRQYNHSGAPSQQQASDHFDSVDFNAIATGQRKPATQSKGRISSNRVASINQKNNNFGAIQQTSMHQYDVSQMSTQSSRNAAKYHTQSKGSVSNHQLQQTSQHLSSAHYPEENNYNNDDRINSINSPMTFGNSPVNQRSNPNYMNGQGQNMNHYGDGNLPHKFKRKSLYSQVRVDMNDHNFNGIEKIEEEPESLVQTPHDMNHPNDAMDAQSSPENQRSLNQKMARPSAFMDSTPRIAPIHELPKEEDRKSPSDFAPLPEIKIDNACEDSEDGIHICQLLPPLDDRSRANNFNKTKKSVHTIPTNRIDPIAQPNFNNSFTKGVHNETGRSGQVASVRPDMGDQDTYEKESTAWKRIESTQQSLYISKNANHKGGDHHQPTDEDAHQNTQSFAPYAQKQNPSVKFQDINHRNPGNKPFMKKTPLNEQAFQKEAALDEDSQENSFEAYDPPDKFVVESNSVRTRQQYLAQQEKAPSEQMFDQSSIVNRQQLDITDVNMNSYFPPTQQNAPHGDGRRGPKPTQVQEPHRHQKVSPRPQQPKMNVIQPPRQRKSVPRKEKGISHNKMYSHLYKNLVPNVKQGHRISNPETVGPYAVPKRSTAVSHNSVSPYKNYVTKLNQYLDKNDKLLQVDLKNRNQDFLERNHQFHDEKERVLTERQQNKMLEERYKEMENCSFKPVINKNSDRIAQRIRAPACKTSEVDIPDEFVKRGNSSGGGDVPAVIRSADNFYKSEMKFVERHEKWREDILKNEMTNFKQGVKSKKISKNSELIYENSVKRKSVVTQSGVSCSQGRNASSIGTSPESKLGFQGPFSDNQGDRQRLASITSNRSCKSSKSIQNFLNRNYHSIQDKKKAVITKACEKVNINLQRQRAQESQKYRTIKSASPTTESMASRSQEGQSPSRNKDNFVDKKFRPTLSQKSVQLSSKRRSGKDVFSALHAEKKQLQEDRSKLEQEDIQKYKTMARQKILRNVNETSASQLAERFEKEFNKIYRNQLDQGPRIYLLDVLEDLKFLDNEEIGKNFAKIELLLANNKQNLLIDLDENKDRIYSIKQNFCEVCLGIQNLSSNYKPHPELDDKVLKFQFSRIQKPFSTPEELIIEQIMVLRDIISRPAFNLNSKQINQFHQLFSDFNATRRNLTFEEKRLGRYQQAVEAEMSKYQDMPNIRTHQNQQQNQIQPNPSINVPNNRDLVSVQNTSQRGRNMQQNQSRNNPAGNSRSLSKASSGSRYNSEKLYMHAQRQKQYKKELKEWYEKKNDLEQQHNLVFQPQLNQVSLHLAQKREKNVIEHAKDYATKQRVDLDTNYVEYMKNKDQCTFKPQTVRNLTATDTLGKENMVQNHSSIFYPTQKTKKDQSGVTASTNFGSGISGVETENTYGPWQSRTSRDIRDKNMDIDTRISPEMRVKAQLPQKGGRQNLKTNPMSKYVSANNDSDDEDPINDVYTSRTHKPNNMQNFLDLSPDQPGDKPSKDKVMKKTPSLADIRSNSGQKPFGGAKSMLEEDLHNKPSPNSSSLPPSGILRPSKSALNTRVGSFQKTKLFQYHSMLPTVEEPICVLKIELDGRNIEEIKVFENDNPEVIVQEFGENFNLSQNAMQRLLDQINEQIQMDENSFQ